jgi:hypothetical protein
MKVIASAIFSTNLLKIALLAPIALALLSSCGNSDSTILPKPPSGEEMKKKFKPVETPDVSQYTKGTTLRTEAGQYQPPWREKTECDSPGSCKSVVINDVTGEIAIKDGELLAPWKATGKGQEITRPKPAAKASPSIEKQDQTSK